MCRNLKSLLVAATASVLVSLPASAAVIVRFDPPSDIQLLNSTFTVDIVADITDQVVGWGLDLTIDNPSVVSLGASPSIGGDWIPAPTNDGDELAGLAFPASVTGTDILLATITLTADAIGMTGLTLSVTPGDLSEGFAIDPTGFADVTFEPGHIQVIIPEPSTVGILVLGLLLCLRESPTRSSNQG